MSKPVSRGTPDMVPPRPTMIFRSERSFMSITRRQVTVRGSMPRLLFLFCILLSMMAASKLCAFSMAAKSPVKCRLMSSMGSTWECPPPVAPPLMPNTGPRDGSRSTTVVFLPILFKPSVRPMETVVFPSPAGVGEMADTNISLLLAAFSLSMNLSGSLALYFPYRTRSSSGTDKMPAISFTGLSFTVRAISISVDIVLIKGTGYFKSSLSRFFLLLKAGACPRAGCCPRTRARKGPCPA